MLKRNWLNRSAGHACIALLYLLGAQIGFRVAPIHPVVASIWPSAGLALAVLLLGGLRLWPGIFLGAVAANALKGIAVPFALVIGIGNTLSAVCAAYALGWVGFQVRLTRTRDTVVLLTLGALCAPIIAASIGTLSIHLAGGAPSDHLLSLWLNWWSGDSIGVILVAPLLTVWIRGRSPQVSQRVAVESMLVVSGLLVISVLLLGAHHEFKHALFLPVGWTAVRYGLRGATVATVLVAIVAIWYTSQGLGPFAGIDDLGLWRLQVFLALLSVGSLVIAAMSTALRASELRFRRIFDSAGIGIALVEADGRITQANPALHAMLGFSGADLSGRTITDITHPEDSTAERTATAKVLAGQSAPYRLVKRYLRRDGTPLWGKLTATHLPDEGNGNGCVIKLIEDLTDQRSAEAALARDEEKLRRTSQLLKTLIDAAPLAILSIDPEGRVRSWNAAAEQIFGWSEDEVIGQSVPFVPPEAFAAFKASCDRILAGESLAGHQVRRRRRDGIQLDLRICAAPIRAPDGTIDGMIAIAEDVTERKRMGEQLKQAQKMEAIGELTGGIAHDFNNILTIVITNAALLADRIEPDHAEARQEVNELHRAALRGAELVRKLMTFSRRRDLELSPINLAEVVCETERSLRRLLPKSVEVITQLDNSGGLNISGDVGAIEQIVFNLATNARDAMPEGGTLRLAVYRAWLDSEHRRSHGWGASGEYIVMAVSDTGCGMSPETRARVFEPFYTTKGPGKGTGLGMAMVYGLVKQHNGYIGLYSEPGHGTTFRLYFPALDPCDAKPAAKADVAPVPGGTERILVVDDDEGLRRTAARVLRRSGYTVEEAPEGESALTLLTKSEDPFDLVVSDVVMPKMGGIALNEALRKHGLTPSVLLMSGYTAEDVRALSSGQPGLKFLHKPWTVTDLLRRVRGLLDEPKPAD